MPLAPTRLTGAAAVRAAWRFLRDPVGGMAQNHAEWGPLIVISDPLPFARSIKVAGFGLPLLMAAGPAFNAEVLGDPAVWRPVAIFPGGPRGSAARRLGQGLARMNGARHAHYRRLMLPPLRKGSVDAMGERMISLAENEIAGWPMAETIDLWARICRLMHGFAIGLLFGGDCERGYPIATMVSDMFESKWTPAVRACPINLPGTPYQKFLKEGEALERHLLDWAASKRGHLDAADLLSIVVNAPEENGAAASDATIIGLLPQMFGAVFEACQNALIWTLVLLAQHPRVAGELLDELQRNLGEGRPNLSASSLSAITDLPWLDAVIKESMRLLPPVPLQARVAEREASIGGVFVPQGARIVLNAFLTNRAAERYAEPASFWPERWATINPSAFEYLVFSAGPRNCPGYLLGMAMLKVAVAAILLRFRVEFSSDQRIDYVARPLLRPRGRIAAILHPQDGGFSRSAFTGNLSSLVRRPQ
jgi:cytochrome P450